MLPMKPEVGVLAMGIDDNTAEGVENTAEHNVRSSPARSHNSNDDHVSVRACRFASYVAPCTRRKAPRKNVEIRQSVHACMSVYIIHAYARARIDQHPRRNRTDTRTNTQAGRRRHAHQSTDSRYLVDAAGGHQAPCLQP